MGKHEDPQGGQQLYRLAWGLVILAYLIAGSPLIEEIMKLLGTALGG